jgi:hypothetical protein
MEIIHEREFLADDGGVDYNTFDWYSLRYSIIEYITIRAIYHTTSREMQ